MMVSCEDIVTITQYFSINYYIPRSQSQSGSLNYKTKYRL